MIVPGLSEAPFNLFTIIASAAGFTGSLSSPALEYVTVSGHSNLPNAVHDVTCLASDVTRRVVLNSACNKSE